ncbi:MAG: hypothetical protein KBD83_04305 [Gammaproteobacteria bacterium]|nr:hypothetical protein [Gammaproteobacteria bacterium]
MKPLKIVLLSIGLVFVTSALPFLLIIMPIYQKHVLLEKQETLLEGVRTMLEQVPDAINKKKQQLVFFQRKSYKNFSLQMLEESLSKNKLLIKSIRPYQGVKHNEINLVMEGGYRDLLRFISNLSRQPNAMDFVYLSIEKNRMEIVLQDNGGI